MNQPNSSPSRETSVVPDGQLFIGGEWTEGGNGTFDVLNPATKQPLGTAASASSGDVQRAIEASDSAFRTWRNQTAEQRGEGLEEWARAIRKHRDELALVATREMGKPLSEARGEVDYAVGFVDWYAEEAKRVYGETIPSSQPNQRIMVLREPVGPVAAITPWNFPIAMITRKLAPALAAGCTALLKPAESTPLTAVRLIELLPAASLPPGTVNLVTGDPRAIGAAIMEDDRVKKITFTGSTETGKLLMKQAADSVKKVSLELGGHAPFIVFDDADVEQAVDMAIDCKFRNGGQSCISVNRFYVHRTLYDEFSQRYVDRVKDLRVGPGEDPQVDVGPMCDAQGLEKLLDHLEDARRKRARILCGGQPVTDEDLPDGFYFAPTVVADVTQDMKMMQEETFGPVSPLLRFEDEDNVVELANDTPYGLAAYFTTHDLSRATRVAERLQFGIVGVNDPVPSTPQAPFGGVKESGIGREGGHFGIEEFLEIKYVSTVIEES